MTNQPAMYDVCNCNHEAVLHVERLGKCCFLIPIGQKYYRGPMNPGTVTEGCGCNKFRFNRQKTANPKPTMRGDY